MPKDNPGAYIKPSKGGGTKVHKTVSTNKTHSSHSSHGKKSTPIKKGY